MVAPGSALAAIGIAGIDTLLSLSLSLVTQGHLTMDQVIATLTINPAQIIGLDAGHLSAGAQADLCLFDAHRNWQLDNQSMNSNGRNSPFMEKELTGKVTRTILGGKTIFSE